MLYNFVVDNIKYISKILDKLLCSTNDKDMFCKSLEEIYSTLEIICKFSGFCNSGILKDIDKRIIANDIRRHIWNTTKKTKFPGREEIESESTNPHQCWLDGWRFCMDIVNEVLGEIEQIKYPSFFDFTQYDLED